MVATASNSPSCDRCRSRKVKCVPLSEDELAAARKKDQAERCRSCYRANVECTHDYIHKKPGRPLGSGTARSLRGVSSSRSNRSTSQVVTSHPALTVAETENGPALGSIFGSARYCLPTGFASLPLFDGDVIPPLDVLGGSPVDFLSPIAPGPLPVDKDVVGRNLDDVLPWTDVCFFIALFLKEQHCLVPIVHKPTFSQDVLNRRDRDDETFRGLLCSIIAYTICQCPISTMTVNYTKPHLGQILQRCTKAAESIRCRQQRNPSLILLISNVLDWITTGAVGSSAQCDFHVAETTRLAHSLKLTEENPRIASNFIETQICRRLYWLIYSKDKTDAMSGRPIILHDFEGRPPLPLDVDDDYITPVGHLPQPERRTSYMVGFVTIARLFQVISQCVARHRAFANLGETDDGDTLRWIRSAQENIRSIMDNLPPSLRLNLVDLAEHLDGQEPCLFAIQQANITITALCAEFALLDFRASLRPEEDTSGEREETAKKAYETLNSIPYEYLASNGESMRGKVLRIILALLGMTPEPVNFSQNVWDWWNMYSRFQFLQVIPDETMNIIDNQPAASTGNPPLRAV